MTIALRCVPAWLEQPEAVVVKQRPDRHAGKFGKSAALYQRFVLFVCAFIVILLSLS